MHLSQIHLGLLVSFLIVKEMDSADSVNLPELTRHINSMKTTWSARETPVSMALLRLINRARSAGIHSPRTIDISRKSDLPVLLHKYGPALPENFDAREKWPVCAEFIGRVWNQGNCLSGWAIVTASLISDRICIESEGNLTFQASAEDILFCCPNCVHGNKCLDPGGSILEALSFWVKEGVVSGGDFNSAEGCKPYSVAGLGEAIPCVKECTNGNYNKSYAEDKNYGKWIYQVAKFEDSQIRKEIYNRGPVVASMDLYPDLLVYKSGIYQHKEGATLGYLSVKILGWGREDDKNYWLVANTLGTDWGQQGMFKILRGENHCGIKDAVYAARSTTELGPREWFAEQRTINGKDEGQSQLDLFLLVICIVLCL